MHTSSKLVLFLLSLAAALVPASAAATPGHVSAGAQVQLLPVGSLAFEAAGMSESESTEMAYGIAGQIDYEVADSITIGFAPRYLLNVIPTTADANDDAATQLDLSLRVQYLHALNPQLKAFVFLAPGYSIIMLPDQNNDSLDNPAGLALGFGAGGRYLVNDKLFVQGEVGYQLGFQGTSFMGTDVTFKSNYLHVGVGVGSEF